VNAFTTRLGVKRFAVLGWSWGGIVAQAVVLRYPDRVSHAVLVGTAPPAPGQAEIQKVWLELAQVGGVHILAVNDDGIAMGHNR
jgi:pimeloyl-ACP methyl ester carboxylesterase